MPDPIEYLPQSTTAPQNPSQQSWLAKKDIGGLDFTIEFNDSVLSTKGWNNPRYSGSLMITQELNKFTEGDITYGKSIGVQRYSRNIYVGNAIVNLDDTNDPTLVPFPSSSYLTIASAITVNSRNLDTEDFTFEGNDNDSKIGFYRSFFTDFPEGKDISIKLLDSTVPNFLEDKYNVFFNSGRLQQSLTVANNGDGGDIQFSSNGLVYTNAAAAGSTNLSADALTATFHSNISVNVFDSSSITTLGVLDSYIDNLTSSSISGNRFFLTAGTNSPFDFLKVRSDLLGLNRRAYYTYEIQRKHPTLARQLNFSKKFGFAVGDASIGKISTNKFAYKISKLDDSIPSLLVALDAENQLPSGIGDAPFIIIPHNIHPFIKDNLLFFLSRAGLDIGNNNVPNKLNTRNQILT